MLGMGEWNSFMFHQILIQQLLESIYAILKKK